MSIQYDLEIVRKILEHLPIDWDRNQSRVSGFSLEGYDKNVVDDHISLLTKAGLMDAKEVWMPGRSFIKCCQTMQGIQFLENTKDPTLWEKVKQRARNMTRNVFLQFLINVTIDGIDHAIESHSRNNSPRSHYHDSSVTVNDVKSA
jgi:hypothetical protein